MALRTVPLSRSGQGWALAALDLNDLDEILATSGEDPESEVTDWLVDGGLDPDSEVVFLSEDDDWFSAATIRSGKVTLFVSEYGAVMASEIGGLYADLPVHGTYGWAGEPELLANYGVGVGELQEMAEVGMDPALAVSELAEALGVTNLLDELD